MLRQRAVVQETISDTQTVCTPPNTLPSVSAPLTHPHIIHPLHLPLPTVPTSMSQAVHLDDLAIPVLPPDLGVGTAGTLRQVLATMQTIAADVKRIADHLDDAAAQRPLQGSGTRGIPGFDDGMGEMASILERVRGRGAERDGR